MKPTTTVPDARAQLTLNQLQRCQNLAARYITFSLTLACPLRCSHCIVGAGPELGATTMPLVVAEAYAAQMQGLADYGVLGVSFTGGEPLLAHRQLEVIARAAAAAGLQVSVVTAAPWGKSMTRARKTVKRFSMVECWDISFDVYHQEWLGFEAVRNACEAVRAAGRRVNLRFTYHDPPSEAEMDILEQIEGLPDVECVAQRVRPVGRGGALNLEDDPTYNPWIKPCLTQGIVVRYDGSMSPCCLNLVEARHHPFQFGDARAEPLIEIHRRYTRHPLLQLIRSIGFGQLRDWLVEAGLDKRLPERLPAEVCELCALLSRDTQIATFLALKAAEPANQLRIALLASGVLGENMMLDHVLQTFAGEPEIESARQLIARAPRRPPREGEMTL